MRPPPNPLPGTPFSVRWQGPDTVCVGRTPTRVRSKKYMEKVCDGFFFKRQKKYSVGSTSQAHQASVCISSSSRTRVYDKCKIIKQNLNASRKRDNSGRYHDFMVELDDNGFYSFRAQTAHRNHPADPVSYTVVPRGVADLFP